jgi:RND family efflux transporter MFP subunit
MSATATTPTVPNATLEEPVRACATGLKAGAAVPSRGAAVLALQAHALAHDELALLLQCDRISIGFQRRAHVQLAAISGGADAGGAQNLVRAIVAAMHEALDQGSPIIHPLPRNGSAGVTLAHAGLAQAGGHESILTLPIVVAGHPCGALVFERRSAFDTETIEGAKDAALFLGPLLEMKHRLDLPLGSRLVQALAPRGRSSDAHADRTPYKLGALVLAGGLGVLGLWPNTYRVVAPARVEGVAQRVIAAPTDGFLRAVAARPGDTVRAGQMLLALEDRDLALQREKWQAEAAQLDKQYREALSQDKAAPIVIARSRLEQARTQLDLAQHEFERSQLTAPFDGVLIAGDLVASIGMPVRRGQELMTVAADHRFRVVVEVDEQDIAAVQPGQNARVMFAGPSEQPVLFSVTRVAPVAVAMDGRNAFEVEGQLAAPDGAALRPGLRGVAKIEIDERSLGAVWLQRAGRWLRRTWWNLAG